LFDKKINIEKYMETLQALSSCSVCPRNCKVDRFSNKLGFCKTDASFNISSILAHFGEEPVISGKNGICNLFFSHCNLQCVYCQNFQISRNKISLENNKIVLDKIIERVEFYLTQGCEAVGFVSPSHFIPQTKIIINTLKSLGHKPIFVFNTNGYDKPETIKEFEGLIDVYLPDFKYADNQLAKQFSDAVNYRETAITTIKEMFRLKGSNLFINDNGYAESGLIIRHLVLPGHVENSINVLRNIAEHISTSVHISLMSQYFPISSNKKYPELNRKLTAGEYEQVVKELDRLGFQNGWIQELESSENYLPDFNNEEPFLI
jgi:putative pyruvate formate lyase activating enzyme